MQIHIDDNSLAAITLAVETLGWRRGIPCPLTDPAQRPDPGHALHLLQTLVLQADNYLPGLIAAAYDHGYTHHDIRGLLGLDPPLFCR